MRYSNTKYNKRNKKKLGRSPQEREENDEIIKRKLQNIIIFDDIDSFKSYDKSILRELYHTSSKKSINWMLNMIYKWGAYNCYYHLRCLLDNNDIKHEYYEPSDFTDFYNVKHREDRLRKKITRLKERMV